ncbi:phage head completion protein [Alteraurantiacibacter palmitatis]|uniref:Head-tail adaptor protein n=1 Tax=Alteraurantiacibacter palmitatis TaxID=2054628 RepID=A0ABV7E3Q0_9SPHN
MTPAGKRDKRITFHEELAAGENAYGEPAQQQEMPGVGRAWAMVSYGRSDERREMAIERSEQVATFTVPANSTTRAITAKHLIRFGGAYWDINGIAPWERSDIQFTAIRRTA